MREDILYPPEASLDEERSKVAISNLLNHEGWINFSNVHNPKLDYWIDRFTNSHAKIPSIFSSISNEVLLVPAMYPLQTFKIISKAGIIYDGAGFANGAVIRIRTKNFTMKILCVDEQIVKLFKYDLVSPDDLLVHLKEEQDDNGSTEDS